MNTLKKLNVSEFNDYLYVQYDVISLDIVFCIFLMI